MSLKACTYNIEHFNRYFDDSNHPETSADSEEKLEAVATVLREVNADLVGVVEAPSASPDAQPPRGTVEALENFAEKYGLRQRKAAMGFASDWHQELAVMYDPDKIESVEHVVGGGRGQSPSFDEKFVYDADGDGIEEVYTFERPPFEAKVTATETGKSFRLILAHAKSKANFEPMDRLHHKRESMANRKKIFAECTWIRHRIEEWMDEYPVMVMGDFNDGPGMDFYERRFGKTGIELVMGDLFNPGRVLRSAYRQPQWTGDGWVPYTASFYPPFGRGDLRVPLDYVLSTEDLQPAEGEVWNPENREDLKDELNTASDHFPVSMVVNAV